MAIRNSVKATLFEPEQPRSRSDEPRALAEEAAPASPIAQRPSESAAQRAAETIEKPVRPVAQQPSESVAQRSSENVAKEAAIAPPPAKDKAFLAAAWHARAEELCAMADTLPCKSSWSLISKIATLYDELARDAGWTKPVTCAPDDVRLEEPQAEEEPIASEDPPAVAPSTADPPPAERIAFSRRPLPLGRRFPRRRA